MRSPKEARGKAIRQINDALRPGEQVVVTCRTRQYRDAVRPEGGAEVMLRAAAAVQLQPLDADTVRSYLCDDAAGPVTRARWAPVLAVLGTEAPAGQALNTPLMISLARAIYNPRPGESAGALRDPAELRNPALTGQVAVESLLFDAFIPAAYRPDPASRWKAQDAERWLEFLARHLERTIGSADLAWWQLKDAAPGLGAVAGAWSMVWFGLTFGLTFGLRLGLTFGLRLGLTAGLMAGLAAGFVFGGWTRLGFERAKTPVRGMRISITGLASGLRLGLAAALWPGLLAGVWLGPLVGIVLALVMVLGVGAMVGPSFGIAGVPGNLAGVTSPGTVLVRDRRVALLPVVVAGVSTGLVAGVWFGFVAGAGLGLGFGLGLSMSQTAWPSYMLTRGSLAFHHQLPWSLMSFLSDAHQRGVLRQAGAVYQFRHLELQRRLATRLLQTAWRCALRLT